MAVSKAVHTSAQSAVVASVASFPDALVGAVVAGRLSAPLYLSPQDCLPVSAASDMDRLEDFSVLLMGGTSVLSADVAGRVECGDY